MRVWLAMAVLALNTLGCGGPKTAPRPTGPIVTYTVNYPLAYFATRIGGELVQVEFPIPADQDPEFFKPSPEIIAAYQKAERILLNGAGYAKWTESAALPISACVDTSLGFAERLIKREKGVTHSHGPTGEHTHSATASYTWLDFEQARLQAKSVCETFLAARFECREHFEKRFAELEKELTELDAELLPLAKAKTKVPIIASHPNFDYLKRRYGLSMRSVHWEPDVTPDEKAIAELKGVLKDFPSKHMLWEGEPCEAAVKVLNSMGIESVLYDTCGNKPKSGDFLSVMRDNVKRLKAIYPK